MGWINFGPVPLNGSFLQTFDFRWTIRKNPDEDREYVPYLILGEPEVGECYWVKNFQNWEVIETGEGV